MTTHTPSPTDADVFAAIRDLFTALDPPPPGLADGALARIAAELSDLDFELLTLIESSNALTAVRATSGSDHVWTLEYRSESCQVRLRIAATDTGRRVDGWVVTDRPMRARIAPADERSDVREQETVLSEHGRFEFADTGTGQAQIWLSTDDQAKPVVTPPFTI